MAGIYIFVVESLMLKTDMLNSDMRSFYRWRYKYILPALLLILPAYNTYASGSNKLTTSEIMRPAAILSINGINPLPVVITFALVLCTLVIYFSMRLKKANTELKRLNRDAVETNSMLLKTNRELEQQRDRISDENSGPDKFYEQLLQSADDGISYYDSEWNLKFSNDAFYSVIGYDRASYGAIDPACLLHPDNVDYLEKRTKSLNETGFFENELKLRHKDGHFICLSSHSLSIKDNRGEIKGFLTISRDITRCIQKHEELVKANVEAETSNRLKTSFLANISHEIRTPLNSVVGFANLLLADNLQKEIKEDYIEHINHNSEKLLQIIGDIIDLSRLESSQIEITYEEASVNSIVNEVIEEARQVIKRNEKSIILNIKNQLGDRSDLIFTDSVWLKRVLSHLMDNAVKFTLDGSVEFLYMVVGNDLVFRIKDTGIGINKENLGRIFEEFRQEIDGHHRPFEGLGIGLTLAKEVVERMGGKIDVQSEKGIGSEFSFSVPYRPAGSTRSKLNTMLKDQVMVPIGWVSRKCLLVDDNKDVLIYLNRILLDTGITTLMARSGYEAIEIVKNTPDIDVIILDMQMPEMNGIEATSEIRKIRKNIPIIAQTAFIFEDDKDIILKAGCDACLIKPIRKEHLLTVMSSFIKTE